MASLTIQLITVSIITLQRQIEHNYYGSASTPINGTIYDYIVVGAGSAGCVVAARLAQNSSVSVLLLESGGPQSVITDMPGNTLYLIGGEFDWNYHVVPQTSAGQAYPDFGISRGKVLGGSSVTNWDIYNRGNRRSYDNWAKTYGLTDWSYDKVLPYFLLSENNTDPYVSANSRYHSTGGLISVSNETLPDPVLIEFRDSVNRLGIPIVDINGDQQFGTAIAQMFWNIDTGIKSSTANTYIERFNRTNLHVLTRAHVLKVLVETVNTTNSRAYGVVYNRNGDNNLVVFANREVIVSAGPINSPQILMLSGIGPSDHLQSLGIPVMADLPVGNNLHDMVFVPLYYRIDNSSLIDPLPDFTVENLYNYYTSSSGPLAHHPDGVTYINSKYNSDLNWPDSMIISVVEYFGDDLNSTVSQYINNTQQWTDYWRPYVGGYYLALDPVLARPLSRGTVRLNATNPYGSPLIDPRYLTDDRDFETILDAVRLTVFITVRQPMKGVVVFPPIPGCNLCEGKYICDDYLRCHTRLLSRSYYNFVGTCRMGNSTDNRSVVDSRLKVKGVSNLRVVDASVIPEIPNGHTNAATIMIAERGAQFIRDNQ